VAAGLGLALAAGCAADRGNRDGVVVSRELSRPPESVSQAQVKTVSFTTTQVAGDELERVARPNGRPLTLAELQSLAVRNSAKIKQAAADVAAVRENAKRAGLYPEPTPAGEDEALKSAEHGYVGAFFEPLTKPDSKLELARAVAVADLMNARLALRRAETDVLSRVRSAYFAAVLARKNHAVARDVVEFMEASTVKESAARGALEQAAQHSSDARKQLAAAVGVAEVPESRLDDRFDPPLPVFDRAEAAEHVLRRHTDVLAADNAWMKARIQLQAAQRRDVQFVALRMALQKDEDANPATPSKGSQVGLPLPVWGADPVAVRQAEQRLARADETRRRVRKELFAKLAEAFDRYESGRSLLRTYRDQILPDQVRAYAEIVQRCNFEDGAAASRDVVVGREKLAGTFGVYLTTLGDVWRAAVDVADLLQSDDLTMMDGQRLPTEASTAPDMPWDRSSSSGPVKTTKQPPTLDANRLKDAPLVVAKPAPRSEPPIIAVAVPQGVDPRLLEPPPVVQTVDQR
jgi:cobalt-zinc-cadmium efflux system outer membrane protein